MALRVGKLIVTGVEAAMKVGSSANSLATVRVWSWPL
jgi:hypothetical protein